MFDHICHEKAIFHKGFRHFQIFISCKMTAVLCSENRRFKLFDCCATNSNCCYEIVRFFVCYPHFPIIINVNNIIVKLFKFP